MIAALRGEPAWLVGGSVRDELLGRPVTDVDLAVAGDPERAARALAGEVSGPVFALSEAFGAWRVIDRRGGRVFDVSPLQGDTIEADLGERDFTINAMARPLEGGELIDPHGGRADLDGRVLRVLGARAYDADPLRPLRLARFAAELRFDPDPETERLSAAAAPRTSEASPERVFGELKRLLAADGAVEGVELADRLGLLAAVLPELAALHDVEQSHFHHLDVYGHTLEVLRRQLELEGRLEELFGELAGPAARGARRAARGRAHARPGAALRRAAARHRQARHPRGAPRRPRHLHRPRRRRRGDDPRALPPASHQRAPEPLPGGPHPPPPGARLPRARAAARPAHRLPLPQAHEPGGGGGHAAVVRRPPGHARQERRGGDRRAPRAGARADGRGARLARSGPPRPPLRGDELAGELGIEPGPELGRLLAELEEAAFTGEAVTREQALEVARRLRHNPPR